VRLEALVSRAGGVQPAFLALAQGQLGPAVERLRDRKRACGFSE